MKRRSKRHSPEELRDAHARKDFDALAIAAEPLIDFALKNYRRFADFDELRQEGALAAIKAVQTWNPDAGAFSTHIVGRVRFAIVDYLRSSVGPIKKGTTGAPRKSAEATPTEDVLMIEGVSDEQDPDAGSERATERIASINDLTGVVFGQKEIEVANKVLGVPEAFLLREFSATELKAAIEHTESSPEDRELLRLWCAKGDLRAWAELTGQPIIAVRTRLASCILPLYQLLLEGKPKPAETPLSDSDIKTAYAGGAPLRVLRASALVSSPTSFQKRLVSQKPHGKTIRPSFGSPGAYLEHCAQVVLAFEFDNLDARRKRLPPEKRSRAEREAYEEAASAYYRAIAPDSEFDGGSPDDGTFAELFVAATQ